MVQYHNWWKNPDTEKWFTEFFQFVLNAYDENTQRSVLGKIDLISVFGGVNKFNQIPNSQIKIFFSGENLTRTCYQSYNNNHHISQWSDLALGFRTLLPKLFRFPLWLTYIPFYKNLKLTHEHSQQCATACIRPFAGVIVCSHDRTGIRSECVRECIKKGMKIDVAGKWSFPGCAKVNGGSNNASKNVLLKRYLVNVCPENSLDDGYTTEKIFQSIEAGCLPIYNGCDPVEPNVLNQSRVVFVKDISKYTKDQLIEKSKLPPFTKNAEFWIMRYYLEMWSKVWHLAHTKCKVRFRFTPQSKNEAHHYFIIPYRDRKEHLTKWLENASKTYSSKTYSSNTYSSNTSFKFDVIVVEQFNDKLFNKGKLLNIGFWRAMRMHHARYGNKGLLSPRPNLIFNDVDVFCKDVSFFRPEEYVYHPYGFHHCLGGVFVCSPEAYLSFNGFSNNYSGWGREDADALLRMKIQSIPVRTDRFESRGMNRSFVEFPHPSNAHNRKENFIEYDKLVKNNARLYKSGVNEEWIAGLACESEEKKESQSDISYVKLIVE